MIGNNRRAKGSRTVTLVRLTLVFSIVFVLLLPFLNTAHANDRGWRWFEVEVLVFRHNNTPTADTEQFPLQIAPFNASASRDLITSHFGTIDLRGFINALPRCGGEKPLLPIVQQRLKTSTAAIAKNERLPTVGCKRQPHLALVPAWYTPYLEVYEFHTNHIPQVITGYQTGTREELLAADVPFTVHQNNFRLQQLRRQINRRSDTEVLLHTAWKQPVFNRNRGRKIRIVGGRNFSEDFDFWGFPKPQPTIEERLPNLYNRTYEPNQTTIGGTSSSTEHSESDEVFNNMRRLFAAIDANEFSFIDYGVPDNLGLIRPPALPSGTPEQVWELDGLLEIYLVGNFLHIAPELNLREIITLNPTSRSPEQQVDDFLNDNDNSLQFLRNYPLTQLRRVISHELHYFDHPKYSMIIEVRRTDLSARR